MENSPKSSSEIKLKHNFRKGSLKQTTATFINKLIKNMED
jgi:hypothetical protein